MYYGIPKCIGVVLGINKHHIEAKAYRVKEEGSPLLSSSHGGLGSCYLVSGRVFFSLFG
jgi:hypothetical protein